MAATAIASCVWKVRLQALAKDLNLRTRVCHFPPGASKWNTIGHHLFCHITQNWRGKPLRTFETIVDLIGSTRIARGLRVKAKLDKRNYPTEIVIERVALRLHDFHGEWNYQVVPRPS